MKSMKGKLLKKLKTIKTIGYLKPERILQVNASDSYFQSLPLKSSQFQVHAKKDSILISNLSSQELKPEIIDVTELMRDLEDKEIDFDDGFNQKENIIPEKVDKYIGVSVFDGKKGNLEDLESKLERERIDPLTNTSNRYLGNRDLDDIMESDDINPEKGDDERELSVLDPKKWNLKDFELKFGGEKIDPLTTRSIWYLGDRDLEDYAIESDDELDEKENIRPEKGDNDREFSVLDPKKGDLKESETRFGRDRNDPLSELDVSKFRRPDLDSGSLFDPNLLAAFEQAVTEFKTQEAERLVTIKEKQKQKDLVDDENNEPPLKARKLDEITDPLLDFEEKCPPGGSNSVILYTTSLRTIRKTFEECHSVRFLLENFRVLYFERDISMHFEYREELWRSMGEKLIPPCLFIRGRYIGGAQRVLALHEQGKLRSLFEGVPIDRLGLCIGCGGARFVVCFKCNGSNKAAVCDDVAAVAGSCPECNENGLIVCPLCC